MDDHLDDEYLRKLLEKAEKISKEKKSKTRNKLDNFIKEYNIREGEDKVPNYVIFYTYRVKWTKCNHTKKVSKVEFFRQFSKLFQSYRVGTQRYYLLNKDSFDLSREGNMEAKFYDETYQRPKKQKNTKKKIRKTSPPGQEV